MKEQVNLSLLLSAKELARLLALSIRTVWRLKSAGKLPKSVRIGSSVRWQRRIIEKWIEFGAPPVREFEMRIKQ